MDSLTQAGRNVGELAASKERLARRALKRAARPTQQVAEKILDGQRLHIEDGQALYSEPWLGILSLLATCIRIRKNGIAAYYNRNGHIEPTNLCRFRCAFCAFRKEPSSPDAWVLSHEEIAARAATLEASGATEVHITGGVHPDWELKDLIRMITLVKRSAPSLHIKAFSAIELLPLFAQATVGIGEGLRLLQAAGLNSLPGGGAEIFNPAIRRIICPEKGSADEWLAVHRAAHQLGMQSNCTMLFGHVETVEDRLAHLIRLRELQDETGGFNCFIPLKFRAQGNALGLAGEVGTAEALRAFAISRLMLDNIQHLKVYWPMLGKANIGLALAHGADDIDGTIGDSTRIYSMAGAEEQRPNATAEELERIVRAEGYIPYERNSLYQIIPCPPKRS